ncbi:uncharacterized protein PADG_12366 [Paracoccidioides brasiliensis Pb18]|uniref:Uncharacterized protein n=1 Tax=Paracoccidioides brasiliensis (strain Pb18) TaxID=502780 RepID=A0A0A0HT71_PARBD|nr:uncharacterized protein PADG_12366 [Paracoccidioides brasiliensis Pb18]KGM91508.1 hypothetical protein PADG_12366 [Paracoccidioides brasiliensis Pb18]
MAARRPNLAPLWLGSAVTGLLPRIPKVCTSSIPPVSLEATVWTMSPQSFMDPTFHRRPNVRRNLCLEKVIPREDEFRLLYITDFNSEDFATVPLCPYPPFGVAKLQETALEVRPHVSCGHSLAYSHWVWQRQRVGSKGLKDQGFTLTLQQSRGGCLALLRRNTKNCRDFGFTITSATVMHGINPWMKGFPTSLLETFFQWVLFNDGVKSKDKNMWNHEWLQLLLNIGVEDTVSNDNSSSSSLKHRRSAHVSRWLQSKDCKPGNTSTQTLQPFALHFLKLLRSRDK